MLRRSTSVTAQLEVTLSPTQRPPTGPPTTAWTASRGLPDHSGSCHVRRLRGDVAGYVHSERAQTFEAALDRACDRFGFTRDGRKNSQEQSRTVWSCARHSTRLPGKDDLTDALGADRSRRRTRWRFVTTGTGSAVSQEGGPVADQRQPGLLATRRARRRQRRWWLGLAAAYRLELPLHGVDPARGRRSSNRAPREPGKSESCS